MYGQCSHHFECKPNLKSILLQSHHKLFNPLAPDNLFVFSLHRGAKVPLRKQTIKHRDHQIYGKGRDTVSEAAAGEQVGGDRKKMPSYDAALMTKRSNPMLFVELLKDQDASVRKTAVHRLGQLGKAAAPHASEIAKMLRDSDGYVRQSAVEVLQQLDKTAMFAEEIVPLLTDTAASVRKTANTVLGTLKAKRSHNVKTKLDLSHRSPQPPMHRRSAKSQSIRNHKYIDPSHSKPPEESIHATKSDKLSTTGLSNHTLPLQPVPSQEAAILVNDSLIVA